MEYRIDKDTVVRFAREDETDLILGFIKDLAEYERMLDKVTATEELLHNAIFIEKKAEVLFCEFRNEPVGFTLFFSNFSTFLGKAGIYLEDLFIKPEHRGKGFGRYLLSVLAKIAVERDCGRLEWWCLNWNRESIDFYLRMGAIPMSDWTVYRITDDKLRALSNSR
ncbi:MAG TPA: GNAT family N-acetyltransferase [Spirochaetia bacterium]|nr:GNAT family N-acetyltransferase [Spirochaetia bacterium]